MWKASTEEHHHYGDTVEALDHGGLWYCQLTRKADEEAGTTTSWFPSSSSSDTLLGWGVGRIE
jgi:hypothetical protein